MKCAHCVQKPAHRCYSEGFDCTGGLAHTEEYAKEDIRRMLVTSSEVEAAYYMKLTRLEEIIKFAGEMGYRRLGMAFCVGLAREAEIVSGILERHFEVYSACCKSGGVDKDELGITHVIAGRYEAACNPAGQAAVLEKKGTELNIVLGLCVGHDVLFNKYSAAPVTTLAVKDRVLGHNPLAAIYSGYYLKTRFR
ncbi:MAG: DUF1847 domain-containing protein [Bacillota bacterium]